jgi:hypothetical protein
MQQYIQNEGLAMGAPTSSLFCEINLKRIDNTNIADILLQHHIVGYFRYADDIPLAYKHGVLTCFNSTVPNMIFTLEKEAGNQIIFFNYHHF